ncbi:hypothetical protein HNR46_001394 [Haloferula luteola]|uniref:Uncharacterized protein n=1 Tax=Haloferula luteola TaxID=595692 RepID=A0A840VB44_9BACT|nr:hypothetical protein [Haloferula luteola]MBB5351160.1 hypothetical protein [Haloferula luteola]
MKLPTTSQRWLKNAVSSLSFLGMALSPLFAREWPTESKLESLQDSSGLWWKAITVYSVPGVFYRLEQSETLTDASWSLASSHYGNGQKWSCRLFPDPAPGVHQPDSSAQALSSTTASPLHLEHDSTPHRQVCLILEESSTGEPILSWSSLDTEVPVRWPLDGLHLDGVWKDFDTAYLYPTDDYLFGLSPRLGSPVSLTTTSPALGPADQAMISAITLLSIATFCAFREQKLPFFRTRKQGKTHHKGDG